MGPSENIGKIDNATGLSTMAQRLQRAEAENARLKAELEQLKPKPVVATGFTSVKIQGSGFYQSPVKDNPLPHDNLKLTFHDGKLVEATVLNQGEVGAR